MSTILDTIVAHKRTELQRDECSVGQLLAQLDDAPPPRGFLDALQAPPIRLIAEVKQASPSAGVMRTPFDPVAIARSYERAGAACVSVLTDRKFFQGSLDDLAAVRRAVDLPLLRKDFIIDARQVYDARIAGADAVLLIAECLPDPQLAQLFDLVTRLGMTPLVELYEPQQLDRVLELDPPLVGINNRNLKTFQVDIEHAVRMRRRIPDPIRVVAESGIRSNHDVRQLQEARIDAMLVGEHLMRADSIESAVRQLLGN